MTSTVHTRDTVMLIATVAIGGVVAPVFAFVGVPLAAAGLAGLLWTGRNRSAAIAAGLAVATGAFAAPVYAVMLAPVFAALYFAIAQMKVRSALGMVAGLTLVVGVAALAADIARAWQAGTTLLLLRTEIVNDALALTAGNVMVDVEGVFGLGRPELVELLVALWPADYFTAAILTATAAVMTAGWAAARAGAEVKRLPGLAELDVSPHVLWAFIAGLMLLAANRVTGDAANWTFAAGLNLLIMVRLPLLAQGLGVAAALYRRIGVGRFGRVSGLGLLVVVEALIPVVSMLGLVDLFANFRKLPREDAPDDGARERQDPE
ncbi:MAG: DUF2232 domain-containing protein [Clostridiales bacterium]|nr:DUF2232 domain-containing protein [Clostridiales bacterium]